MPGIKHPYGRCPLCGKYPMWIPDKDRYDHVWPNGGGCVCVECSCGLQLYSYHQDFHEGVTFDELEQDVWERWQKLSEGGTDGKRV